MALLEHTLGILMHPDSEWRAIRSEKHSFVQVFLSHIPLLALIPCVSAYIGVTQVGWSVGDGDTVRLAAHSAMWLCVFGYVAFLTAIYVLGEYINWMSRSFGVKDGAEQRHYEGTAMAVYVSVPVLLSGLVLLYPEIWVVTAVFLIAGSYSVYLLYEGTPILMNIPKDQGFIYASSVVTVGLCLAVVVMISTVIVWSMVIQPVYID